MNVRLILSYLLIVCQIAVYVRGKINQISLSGCDARSFCLGVRLVNQRTIQQVILLAV